MRGVQVTTNSDIPYAADDDFTINTKFRGGLKVHETKYFNISRDFINDPSGYYYLNIPHGLPYVPAVLGFVDGNLGFSFQNSVIPGTGAVADETDVFMSAAPGSLSDEYCLIIFREKVADS